MKLHKNDLDNVKFFKYTRAHLFDMFNAFHQKNEFDYFLNYVSKRIVLYAIQHKRL